MAGVSMMRESVPRLPGPYLYAVEQEASRLAAVAAQTKCKVNLMIVLVLVCAIVKEFFLNAKILPEKFLK